MYTVYVCNKKLNENIFDIKYPLSELENAINFYKLTEKKIVKEYWDNNVLIIFSEDNEPEYNYIEDIEISYNIDKNILIQEYNKNTCIPYTFFNVNNEEIYTLYEDIVEDVSIKLKKSKDYFTIDFTSNDLNKIKNVNIFYI